MERMWNIEKAMQTRCLRFRSNGKEMCIVNNGQTITVEVFLEAGCQSADMVLEAIDEVGEHFSLEKRVYKKTTDPGAFIRHGILITPATYIDGHLAFYGAMTASDIIAFIYNHVSWTKETREHIRQH